MISIFRSKIAQMAERRIITSGVRWLVSWLSGAGTIGAFLLLKHFVTPDQLQSILSHIDAEKVATWLIVTGIPAILSLRSSTNDAKKTESVIAEKEKAIAVAGAMPAGTSPAEAKAVVKEGHFKFVDGQLVING